MLSAGGMGPPGWVHGFKEQPRPDDVAFVASQRFRRGDPEATLKLRHTEDGRLAVLAFSSLSGSSRDVARRNRGSRFRTSA